MTDATTLAGSEKVPFHLIDIDPETDGLPTPMTIVMATVVTEEDDKLDFVVELRREWLPDLPACVTELMTFLDAYRVASIASHLKMLRNCQETVHDIACFVRAGYLDPEPLLRLEFDLRLRPGRLTTEMRNWLMVTPSDDELILMRSHVPERIREAFFERVNEEIREQETYDREGVGFLNDLLFTPGRHWLRTA